MAGVMFGNCCSSLSVAMFGSTSLPTCAPAGATSAARNAKPPTIAAKARCISLMSLAPSIADIRERVGEAEQPHLHHHPGGEQGGRLGMHDLLDELPIPHARIKRELILGLALQVRGHA